MKDIKALSRRIAREFKPNRIVLFGSYADGTPSSDSDVDLLIVLPHEGRAVDTSVQIRLKTKPTFPLDLLVRSPQKVRARLAMGDTFMQEIMEKGKVLYEADNS